MSNKINKAIHILKSLNSPDRVVNRDRINFTKFMSIIGNPFNQYRCIHITGTNGKGSVSLKTAKVLESAGFKVGVYTSPHIFSFRERIQVNGQNISPQQISNNIIKIQQISKKENLPLSYFQYMTAAGFMHFKQKQCDYVALQVGLGGKNDTTNLVYPQISVITSIGLDHTDLLGPTLDHIAREKSGIIKKNRPVVLGPAAQGYPDIQQSIKQNNCMAFRVQKDSYKENDFESQNNAIVIQTIKALRYSDVNLEIQQSDIDYGLKWNQPCRMQLLKQQFLPKWAKDKKVYFDVGHNSAAMRKIKQYMQNKGYKSSDTAFVFGASKGKNFGQSLSQIQKVCNNIYLIQADHFRASKIQQLQSHIGQSKYPNKYRCISDGKIDRTLQYVMLDPNVKVVVVIGSFFIMPQARGYFQPSLIENPEQNINQIYKLNQKNQK